MSYICKARDRNSRKNFVIKKIPLKENQNLGVREKIKTIARISDIFVVQYFDVWIEKNNTENKDFLADYQNEKIKSKFINDPFILYIQMELLL